ncbi:phospholipase A2-alpha isoform X2 [Mercurialis annua]|uniref:phospholipase A2-alpha isoform X2 n=1 Tax=Mercurialis annua TaxID=3986 RepID=UPI00215F623A|nr:phospholipase A2-alpha isoform X2 [Mercurialis annua]
MANLINQSFNYVILSTLLLFFSSISVDALNIGVQATDAAVTLSKECSRKCESEFCSVPPFLRYGKYCGLLYSGCPGEKPCDGLDACCMNHDACVQAKNNDYLSQECSQNFINCMGNFKKTGGHTFKGNKCDVNDVIDVISLVMDAALLAGTKPNLLSCIFLVSK